MCLVIGKAYDKLCIMSLFKIGARFYHQLSHILDMCVQCGIQDFLKTTYVTSDSASNAQCARTRRTHELCAGGQSLGYVPQVPTSAREMSLL